MTKEEFFKQKHEYVDLKDYIPKLSLPKWPQALIFGEKVTEEQADEIIRRTDTFFQGWNGNDRDFIKRAYEIVKYPDSFYDGFSYADHTLEECRAHQEERHRKMEKFKKAWRPITTEYIQNSWISCSYIGGPHGWCNPDGTINYSDNIGKWPEIADVFNDATILARAFPFLHLYITLANAESGEDDHESVVTIEVKDSEAHIWKEPLPYYEARGYLPSIHNIQDSVNNMLLRLQYGIHNEGRYKLDHIQQWANKVYKKGPKKK